MGDCVTEKANILRRDVLGSRLVHLHPAMVHAQSSDTHGLHFRKRQPVGPEHPFTSDGKAAGAKNHRSGHVEDAHLNDYNFDDQYNTFHRCDLPAA